MGPGEYFLAIRDTIALIRDTSSLQIKGCMSSNYGKGAHYMYIRVPKYTGRSPPVQWRWWW